MGFYTNDPTRLAEQVEGFLQDVERPMSDQEIRPTVAAMVPHAGLEYSGPIAAYSYDALRGQDVSTVILLGNSHRPSFRGAALSPDEAWDTPLGPIEIDREMADELAALGEPFIESRQAHAQEHSLEVQLPFIKTVLPDAKLVPILLASATRNDLEFVANALAPLVQRPDVVLVCSSDMAHYPVYEEAVRSDKTILEAVKTLDVDTIIDTDEKLLAEGVRELHCTLCAMDSVLTTVMVANRLGVTEARVLDYRNSGDTAGNKGRCVGYGAVAFLAPAPEATGGERLTDEEKVRLLKLARQTLEAELAGGEKPAVEAAGSELLARDTACFVTLKLQGRLRGCIGELEPRDALVEAVASRAVAAATQDPRFRPVTAEELPLISIDISAMTPLRRIDSPEDFVVGKHGIVVRDRGRSGVFLPQVAPEQGWDREETLSILCEEKAGLPRDAWKKGAELWVFEADVFSEEGFGLAPPESLKKP